MVAELIPPTPSTTIDEDTLRMGVYNRAARRRAALAGWETRRHGKQRSSWGAFVDLCRQVADAPARLLCCDLAERLALPIFQAAYPDDPRLALVLWVARRVARGTASEVERLGMRRVACALCDEAGEDGLWAPASRAVQASTPCLAKSTREMLWGCCGWLEHLDARPREALYQEVVTALETMPTRTRTRTIVEGRR